MSGLTAIYGGAFDPVHDGHLAVANAAARALDADVRLLPTGDARHRAPAHATGAQRVAMLHLAIRDNPRLRVDTREIERAGASYTVDTLEELRAELGAEAPLAMIVGADAFVALASWHRWRDLFGLAHLVVAERPGILLPGDTGEAAAPASQRVDGDLAEALRDRWAGDAAALHRAPAGRLLRLRLPLQPESSSAVRARVGAGASIEADVPPAVAAYIREHRLYS